MKTTEHFKNTIEAYLRNRAETDKLFAVSFNKSEKNLDDCITYILNCVKQSGCNGFADDEIFSMAVHFYDEDNIEIGNPIDCNIIVNHTIELTAEEKEQARQNAIKRAENDAYERMTRIRKRPNVQPEPCVQKSLFDE
ncbi:PcfK-like family protein [Proteiniphilum propionicum]|uniref:PcfK-like family protein n=1 Tax=Proteiniphilum propionicum TaxID=2829812 RepID=UPI001EEAF429|nr:PcfK-like family protein [Proteiniphilum propionicum]ULB34340.1 PcfK-like family protein [Proteiniphilum propionicum]